jgi:hypothetical protein
MGGTWCCHFGELGAFVDVDIGDLLATIVSLDSGIPLSSANPLLTGTASRPRVSSNLVAYPVRSRPSNRRYY